PHGPGGPTQAGLDATTRSPAPSRLASRGARTRTAAAPPGARRHAPPRRAAARAAHFNRSEPNAPNLIPNRSTRRSGRNAGGAATRRIVGRRGGPDRARRAAADRSGRAGLGPVRDPHRRPGAPDRLRRHSDLWLP